MAYSESQKRASRNYNEKAYDRLEIKVPKGQKDIIKEFALKKNQSLNEFVNNCIFETIKKGEP